MWWTITGNFGNILPIDWSKSYARKLHLNTLNINENPSKADGTGGGRGSDKINHEIEDEFLSSNRKKRLTLLNGCEELTSEDEAIANDLDMHALILNGLGTVEQEVPIKSVEEVIKEIEYIIEEAENSQDDIEGEISERQDASETTTEVIEKAKEVLGAPLYAESKCAPLY